MSIMNKLTKSFTGVNIRKTEIEDITKCENKLFYTEEPFISGRIDVFNTMKKLAEDEVILSVKIGGVQKCYRANKSVILALSRTLKELPSEPIENLLDASIEYNSTSVNLFRQVWGKSILI